MNDLPDLLWIEMRKAGRSRLPWFTAAGSLVMPLGIAFLIYVATHPAVAERVGLVSAKANLVAYAATDWPIYLALLAQMVAAGGFFLSCLIVSWVFGREWVDGTLKDLLAVPVARAGILLAKFLTAAAWSAAVTLLLCVTGLALGAAMALPGGSAAALLRGSLTLAATTGLTIVVVMPFALFASVGRGYLLPIGLAVLVVVVANLVAVVGLGAYFPWAVAGLYAQGKGYLEPASFPIAILTGLAGMLATYLWWKYADQNR